MPFSAYEAESFWLSFLLLIAAVVYAFLNPGGNKKIAISHPLILLGSAFWALALLSVFLSEAPYVSFIFFCFFSAMPVSFLLTLLVDDKEIFFKFVGYGVAIILFLSAAFTIYEYFFLPGWMHKGFAHWPLADPNSLASLFSLGFFGAFGWMIGAKARRESNAALVLCIAFLSAIFTTGSQGGLFALLVALAIFCYFARFFLGLRMRRVSILIAASMLIFSLFSAYALSPPSEVFFGDGNIDHRFVIAKAAWNIFKDHFWAGTGIGTFFLYYPAYRGMDYNSAGFMVHSDPLQFAVEMGVAAPILFYTFAATVFFISMRIIMRIKTNDKERIAILAPFCAMGALFAQSHVNFPFNILPLLMISGFFIGFLHWRIASTTTTISIGHTARQVFAFGFVVLAFLFGGLQGSEILVTRAQQKLERGDMNGFMYDVNLAGKTSLYRNARAFVLAAAIPVGILEVADTKNISFEQRKELFKKAEYLLAKAALFNPTMPSISYYAARLYTAVPQEGKIAEKFLKEALGRDQMHTPSRLMMAGLWEKQGRKKEALELLMVGIDWPNVNNDYYQKVVDLARDLGDMETRDTALAKMLVANARQMAISYTSKHALRP